MTRFHSAIILYGRKQLENTLKNQVTLESLRQLAGQFQQKSAEISTEAEPEEVALTQEDAQEEIHDELPALPAPEEEEYLEFPVLRKHKTYSVSVIKPVQRQFPKRGKTIKSKISALVVHLKDYEVFEPVAMQRELQPFVLKNSHAVIEGMENCQKITFELDSLGNSVAHIELGDKKEKLKLGCIIRYELLRPDAPALTVSSRDLDSDAAVIGGPCEIEFIVEDKSQPKYEKASLVKLSEAEEVSKMNEEAGHSISWVL